MVSRYPIHFWTSRYRPAAVPPEHEVITGVFVQETMTVAQTDNTIMINQTHGFNSSKSYGEKEDVGDLLILEIDAKFATPSQMISQLFCKEHQKFTV